MRARGQIILIVAILLMVMALMLAIVVDAGRLYLEHVKAERAVQAGADSGIGLVSDAIVTLAAAQQATAIAAPCPGCTPTPDLEQAERWLSDDDRATLVSPAIRTQVANVALDFASQNGLNPRDPSTLSLQVAYPHAYDPEAIALRVRVSAWKHTPLLLVGFLNREWVDLPVEGISEVRQR